MPKLRLSFLRFHFAVLVLIVAVQGTATNCSPAAKAEEDQQAAEQIADQMLKRFYETLQFATIWNEFYVKNPAFRKLEVEAIMSSLVLYRAEKLPASRIDPEAMERAYIAIHDFWATLSAGTFTSGKHPDDPSYGRLYESITQRPKPYANSAEMDKDFTAVLNRLSDINRKLVIRENVGSASYLENVRKFEETRPPDPNRIKEVFAEVGLARDTPVYVVRREMFHIFMIEEKKEFKVLTILNRFRD